MIWVDYCILVAIALSVLIGIYRGMTRELLGLGTWVLALGLAFFFADETSEWLARYISDPSLRLLTACVILFLLGLLIGALATSLLVETIRNSPLSGADRTLGGGFGLLRALVIVSLAVMLASHTEVRQARWWQDSLLVTQFQWVADALSVLIPDAWLEKLHAGTPSTLPLTRS